MWNFFAAVSKVKGVVNDAMGYYNATRNEIRSKTCVFTLPFDRIIFFLIFLKKMRSVVLGDSWGKMMI